MKAHLIAAVATLLALVQSVNQWLGRQIYLTVREIHEFGFADQLERQLDASGADRGQLGFQTIIAAIVVVVGVMLAVIILDQMDQSLGTPSNSDLATSQNDVLTGFSDMASLVAPLLLVAIAVVIIGLLRRVS
jgi:hypothetical protein